MKSFFRKKAVRAALALVLEDVEVLDQEQEDQPGTAQHACAEHQLRDRIGNRLRQQRNGDIDIGANDPDADERDQSQRHRNVQPRIDQDDDQDDRGDADFQTAHRIEVSLSPVISAAAEAAGVCAARRI